MERERYEKCIGNFSDSERYHKGSPPKNYYGPLYCPGREGDPGEKGKDVPPRVDPPYGQPKRFYS